jgi:fibronectin-binding autotransporter adhesin
VKNNLQKILSISHEVKSPLDSNKENIFAKLQPPITGSITMKKNLLALALFAGLTSFAGSAKAAPLLDTTSYNLPMNLGDAAYFGFTGISTVFQSSTKTGANAYISFIGQNPHFSLYPKTQVGVDNINSSPIGLGIRNITMAAGDIVSSSTSFTIPAGATANLLYTGSGRYYAGFRSTVGEDSYYGYFQFLATGGNTTLQTFNISTTANTPVTIVNTAISTLYWLGSNGTVWSAGNNWSSDATGSPVADFADGSNIIIFSATGSSNSTTTNLGGDRSIGSLTINSTNAVGISGGNLTINGASAQAITVEAGNLTISSPLILAGSATTITANQSTSIASITAANGLVFNGTSSVSTGAITANGSLQKLGSGITTLTGNNTYSGNTTISDGTLALTQNGTLGNSTVSISGGTLDMGGKSLTNTLGTLTGGELANGTLTNNGSRFNLQNGTVSATLAGTNGVNKTTSGTVILSGSNTYNGTTFINAGTLQIGNASGLGSGGNITFGGGILQYGSGITTDVSSSIKNSGSAILIDTNGNDVTFGSSINGTNNGGLSKLGAGTLALTGNNSYTGGTFIESGTLTGNNLGLKGNITNNATLLLGNSGYYQFDTTGTGTLLVAGGNTTDATLTGNASMTGGNITIQSGTLTIGATLNNVLLPGSISGNISNEGTLRFYMSSVDRTYADVISGNGSFQTTMNQGATPTGIVYLTGNNTYSGGTTISGGAINISSGSLLSNGSVAINGTGKFDIGSSNQTIGQLTLNGTAAQAQGNGTLTTTAGNYDLRAGTVSLNLAGSADIVKNATGSSTGYGAGLVYMSGNNAASSGNITINGGILSFSAVQSLYGGSNASWTPEKITVGANATLALGTGDGSATSGFSDAQIGQIFQSLTQNSTGTLTPTTGLTANSSIGFNVSGGNFTLNSTISNRLDGGVIGMDKIGSGTLVLGANNQFTGPLNIYEGIVRAGGNNSLSPNSSLVVETKDSTKLSTGYDVGNFTQQFIDVTLISGTLAGGTGTINATGNYTMKSGNATANLSGAAPLLKTGDGIVYLSGNNSYIGTTTVNGSSSTLGTPVTASAKLQFQNSASLYTGNNATWNTGNITVNSGGIFSVRADESGAQGFTSEEIGTLISNLVTESRGSGGFLGGSALGIDTNGANMTLSTALTDSGITSGNKSIGLVKYGNGTLTLSANNTHSLITAITGGTLAIAGESTLSGANASLSIRDGSLDMGSTLQTVSSATATYGSILGNGTLTATAGGFTFGSSIIEANLAGFVGASINSGTTVLSGSNTYTGNTTLGSSAILNLANVNALSASTLVHNNSDSTIQFSVAGTNTYNLGGLEGANQDVNIAMDNNTLSIGANNRNTSYIGVLSDGAITKVGNGTLTFAGNNTYTGGTTITSGTLALGNNTTGGSVTGDITNNANLVFNRSNDYDYFGVVSGNGTLTQAGNGTLTLGANQTYTGSTTVTSGTLWLGGSATLASAVVNIASGGMFYDYNSGLSQDAAVQNSGRFDLGSLDETVGSISGNGSIQLVGNLTTGGLGYEDLIAGNITGLAASSLTKVGTGNLTITGSATNGGGLVISAGTLSIGNGNTSGSVTGNITNNAALAFNRSNEYTYNGIVSGTGTLEQVGAGTTILGGNNTYSGGTIITAGTLQGTTQSLQGAITNNATLVFNQSTNGTYSGALGGTGDLSKNGTGTLTLSGTGSFSGNAAINSGTLAVTGSLASATTQINSGATLTGSGTLGAVIINAGGTIAPGNSPGTITTGNMTWNGGGIYDWELGNATGSAGTGWDLISSTGSLTINADSGPQFTIAASTNSSSSGFDPNARYYSWKIAEFANIQGFSSDKFIINPTGFEGGLGILTLSANNTALNLNYATMATWNAGTGNWTTSSNWEGEFAPIDGVAVEYAGPLGTNGTSTNDDLELANISGLTFTSGANGSFTVAGGALEIGDGGIVNNSTFTQTVGLNITLGANQTFAANTANLIVSGNITGGYSLTKEGNQTLAFAGANTYTGETTINAGTLSIAAGGSLNGTTKILVGNSTSSNTLSILGAVSTTDLTLSQQVGSDNNTVTVGGGSSPASLTVANLLNVGFGGTGNTLDILGNGTVTAGSTEIGGFGANNTLNLTGGVLNSTGYLVVGYFADDNALNITAGGNATVGSLTVGLDAADGNSTASANNTILVSGTGSALHTAGLIYLGENGTSNTISIENGGKVVSQNDSTVIGVNAGSNGNSLSINGTGSQFTLLTNNKTLYVGQGGSNNTLSITNGGNLTTTNARIGGNASSANNTATVSGAGSIWNNAGKLRVGSFGSNNSLTISGGSAVVAGNDTFLGAETGSTNNLLTVNGNGSSFSGATDLVVGYNGTSNALSVINGGNVSLAGALAIGYNAVSSNNTAMVSGVGSTLSAQNIQIGSGADNKLIVADSATVSTANIFLAGTNATLQIGNGTSAGNLSLTGSILTSGTVTGRSVVFDHTDSAYQFGSILSGDLALSQVGTGTTTLTANNTYTGGTTISAGTLALGGTAGSVSGNITVNAGASFSVNRTNDFTLGNIISGAGSFAHIGSNKTSITAVNNYTGGTTISSGTLWTKNSHALGTGNVLVNGGMNGGKLLTTSSQEPIMGNQTLSIGGNLDWTSGKIAFYDTGSSPLSGDLTINVAGNFTASAGNKTFDFSEVEALGYGNYTLVNATVVSAGSAIFVAAHGPYTTLFGNFTTTNNTVVYTVTGAESTGSDIQNNGGPNTPVVAVFDVTQATQTIGANNTVNALDFSNSASLTIDATGQLTVTSGTLGVQTGSSVVSGGTLNTPGNFDKTGAGELDLDNTTNVNGIANVVAGLLSVNGQLNANSVMVDPTATLGGAGVIVAQNVVVNGNLSPGNSPGTLNVVGNLVLGAGSSTVIEIESPTNFDRIVVSGTATLGGTLNAVAYGGGTITPGARYDFLQAGSINGEFDSLIAPDGLRIRFLNSGTVGSLLFGPESFVPYALNQNQINVAKALDIFVLGTEGDAIVVGTALDSLTTEQFPAAFDQIMPGFYESLANIAIEQAFAQTQMLNQRISSVRLGAAGFQAIGGISQPLMHDKNGKSAADAKDASPIVESATATNWNAWALGTGMFSRSTNLGSLQNYNNDAGGFLVGADYRWSENFVSGLYAGYDYSYAEYNGGGSTKGNSFSFGTYASYAKDGYYADAVIGGGYTGFQTKRSIEFSTIDRTASADPNSGQFTAGINLGKDFEVGKFTLGPIVGAQYTYAGIGSFTESGAESLDLSLGQQNANSLRSTLGGRIAYTWNLNQKIALIPEVRMFWQHEFLNNPRNINASLDGGNGAAFDFETGDPYRNSVFAGAGVTAQFGKNLSGSVFYNINFGSQTYQSNMVSAGLNFSF